MILYVWLTQLNPSSEETKVSDRSDYNEMHSQALVNRLHLVARRLFGETGRTEEFVQARDAYRNALVEHERLYGPAENFLNFALPPPGWDD